MKVVLSVMYMYWNVWMRKKGETTIYVFSCIQGDYAPDLKVMGIYMYITPWYQATAKQSSTE